MSKIEAKILIVDDDQDVLLAAKLFLKQHFNIVHTEKEPGNIPNLLANENYDVILLDMNFSKDATSGKMAKPVFKKRAVSGQPPKDITKQENLYR